MGISRSESGEFSFRFWGFSIDKTQGEINCHLSSKKLCVNALSGLYLISTSIWQRARCLWKNWSVNALSGLYLISTRRILWLGTNRGVCQCPLWLIHHFYWVKNFWKRFRTVESVNTLSGLYIISTSIKIGTEIKLKDVSMLFRAYTSFLRHETSLWAVLVVECQCPFGLIHHFYNPWVKENVLPEMCQCPFRLIHHFY